MLVVINSQPNNEEGFFVWLVVEIKRGTPHTRHNRGQLRGSYKSVPYYASTKRGLRKIQLSAGFEEGPQKTGTHGGGSSEGT